MKTAALFLIFNRPDTTKQVFEAIRKAKPPRLYVAADGPRADKAGEAEKVEQVRQIATQVDWDCEVKTLFRDKNLGCGKGVSSAIDWFFENEEEGIILEDDCLPSQSFFWFCEELLERYRGDMRVMIISGYNKQEMWNQDKYDYFFSNFGGIWGWASWKRAWDLYDLEMKDLESFIENNYFEFLLGESLGNVRKKQMLNVIQNNIDTWDYQWGFTRHVNSGLACVPSKNLVENIGFGADATHTIANQKTINRHDLNFPVKYNEFIVSDKKYDELFLNPNNKLSIKRLFKWRQK
ncbi:MAG: hypothetical protein JRE64_06340 [Deltaproteobacteria bacterium]|nr:hypothetical protein [Deltaproteobacteria bacterium]